MYRTIEYTGSFAGIIGTLLLAFNNEYSGYGFLFYMVSNVCFIIIGYKVKLYGLLVMQLCFVISSFIGVYVWLL